MKQVIGLTLFFFTILVANAQSTSSSWCATDEMLEQWFESHPEDRARFLNPPVQELPGTRAKGAQNSKAPNYIIPVVVHVIHFDGSGSISNEQIQNGIDIINDDFNRLNDDTSDVRNTFKPYIADAQIEFRLARKDPNGNSTDGINRINSFLTYDNRNEVKSLSYWDAKKYFNVWIVNTINDNNAAGSVLGYAQFPRFGADSTYGVVVRADEWGSIGQSAGNDGRTVTHEMGHCLDLYHTFQSGCGFNCTNSGDRVCDTPPQFSSNNNSCDTTLNTCTNDSFGGSTANPNPYSSNVPDQLENYMGYGLTCLGMFTEGQKTRMESALTQVTKLVDLTKSTNLAASGTNNGYNPQKSAPVADLYFDVKMVCKGDSVSFTDNSYRDTISSYEWTFTGGSPSTSSLANPTIAYNTPGVYDVKLKVSNSVGADSIVVEDHVIVHDTANNVSGFGYFEGFESSSSFSDWTIISNTSKPEWERTSVASYSGNNSAYLKNYDVVINDNMNVKQADFMISPPIDMSQVVNPSIRFKIAYQSKNQFSNDNLKIGFTTTCGVNWSTRFLASSSSSLINSGTSSNNFVPNGTTQWKTITISNLTTAMKTSKNLVMRFDFTSGDGNNIYIDDVEVLGNSIVGLEDTRMTETNFTIYPNPADNNGFYIEVEDNSKLNQAQIYITNIVGEKVLEITNPSNYSDNTLFIDTEKLSSGIYFVSYQNGGRRITKKLIIS